ncbi:MAG: tyrosine-type recombinase/integrase [Myxococcales bacterium]|nr:tyrosine-type recombinase/integrase [Myxococcales bacterium]
MTGNRIRITAGTLSELEHKTRKVLAVREGLRWGELTPKAAAAALRPAAGQKLTVLACWERYFPGVPVRSKAIARSNWERRLRPYFAELQVWELDKARMAAWAAKLEAERFAPKTIRGAYDWLAGAVAIAVDDGALDGWPWGNWRPKRALAIRTRESCDSVHELARLLAAARALDARDWHAGRYADRTQMLAVMALCGMRQGEVCGLAWDCVDLTNGVVAIRYQAGRGWPERWPDGRPRDPTKTKPRTIRLHPDAVAAFEMQQRQLEGFGWYRDGGPVFPSHRGEFRKSGRAITPDALRALVASAGLPNVENWVTHSLRHTFASLEVHHSDPRSAQSRTGHASIAQLEVYLHPKGRGLAPSAIPRLPGASLLHSPPQLIAAPEPELASVELSAEVVVNPADATVRTGPHEPEPPTVELVLTAELMKAERGRLDAEAARAEQANARRRESARPFEDLARDWIAVGKQPRPRPPAVTRAVRVAYVRAYKAELARAAKGERWEQLSPEARQLIAERDPEHTSALKADLDRRAELARGAGRRARKASLGAWGQAVKRVERSRHREAGEASQALGQ